MTVNAFGLCHKFPKFSEICDFDFGEEFCDTLPLLLVLLFFPFFLSNTRVWPCPRVQDAHHYHPSNSLQKLYFLVFMLFITMSSVFDLRCDIYIILLFNFMKNSVNSCRALQIFTVMMQVLLVLLFLQYFDYLFDMISNCKKLYSFLQFAFVKITVTLLQEMEYR